MEKFGRYQLLKQIAAGGMGEIFLARSTSLDGFEKDLVIKRILPTLGANERFVSMFLDEARVSMSLSHQNIVQVFDFGDTDGRYFIAMEHVYGSDLRTVLKLPHIASTGIDPGLALYIIAEVCKALDYAHQRRGRTGEPLNLVHRDVSPDNILVSFDGGVKITDFGIAKARGQATKLEPGAIIGKVSYMAPEQASSGHADPRTDVFSCGAVLWELLVGQKMYTPQKGDTDEIYYHRVCTAQIEKPSEHNRNISRRLDKLVMKAVSPLPEDRHESARDLAADINEVLGSKYKRYDSYNLQEFMAGLKRELRVVGFDDLEPSLVPPSAIVPSVPVTRQTAPPTQQDASPKPREPVSTAMMRPPDRVERREKTVVAPMLNHEPTPELLELAEEFKSKPSLWQMVHMGEVCAAADQQTEALACYRVAAVKFAQHGLLAQALLCAKKMLELRSPDELHHEISVYPTLAGKSDERIVPYLFRSGGQIEEILAELIEKSKSARKVTTERSPLLSHFNGEAFALLAELAPLQRHESGTNIVTRGEEGRTMYLLLSGRALVAITKPSGENIWVASLAAGDFFGEKSFFSGAPRGATVEAMENVAVIEIDQDLYDRVMAGNPEAANVLMRFYKERIVDSILATSATFGILPARERRAVLTKLVLKTFEPGQQLIQRGGTASEIYLLKRGLAEIWTGEGEKKKVAAVLSPGMTAGELAAITGKPSPIAVTAKGTVEAFALAKTELKAVFDRNPDLEQRWLQAASDESGRL